MFSLVFFNLFICWQVYAITTQPKLLHGIRGLRRGLGDPPPKWIQEPLVVRNRDGRPARGPSGSALFLLCSVSALLGDLLGVSKSTEYNLLSVLSIYPRIFLCMSIHCVSSLITVSFCVVIFCCMFTCVRPSCFSLVVSTCQVIG